MKTACRAVSAARLSLHGREREEPAVRPGLDCHPGAGGGVRRYTFTVEKTPGGWKIRKVLLDPLHYRSNQVGLELVQGKRLA